jgi:hypothetical protein
MDQLLSSMCYFSFEALVELMKGINPDHTLVQVVYFRIWAYQISEIIYPPNRNPNLKLRGKLVHLPQRRRGMQVGKKVISEMVMEGGKLPHPDRGSSDDIDHYSYSRNRGVYYRSLPYPHLLSRQIRM